MCTGEEKRRQAINQLSVVISWSGPNVAITLPHKIFSFCSWSGGTKTCISRGKQLLADLET
jgi:hypothetical protein